VTTRILLVDDEPNFGEVCAAYLGDAGHAVDVACSADDARACLAMQEYDGVFLDLVLPGEDGLSLLSYIRRRWPALPVIMVTAHDRDPRLPAALALGAGGLLVKPVEMSDLRALVEEGLLPRVPE